MLTPITDAEGTLLDFRYASVDDRTDRAAPAHLLETRRPAAHEIPLPALTRARARQNGGPEGLPGPSARRGRAVSRFSWTAIAALALVPTAAVSLAGCARDSEPATFAVPRAAAAEIRMTCPPGTFIGTMTVNCPQPLTRAAPAR